jgi:hypothetical protein
MNRKAVLLAFALFVAIVGGMFVFAYLKNAGAPNVPADTTTDTPVAEVEEKPLITRVDAKHYYTVVGEGGVHTVAGELMLPTACDLITNNVVLLDEGKRAVISFDIVNNSNSDCEKATAPQRFKIGFPAAKDITIEAVFMGETIPLNLVEAGPGESPADFELFIKG